MNRNEVTIKGKFHYRLQGWKQSGFVRILLFLSIGILFYLVMADRLVPETYNIQPNTTAEKTIEAPRQIENTADFIKAQEEAAGNVTPQNQIVPMRNEQLVEYMYDKLELMIIDKDLTNEDKISFYRNVFPTLYTNEFINPMLAGFARSGKYNDLLIEEMRKNLTEQQYRLPEEIYYKLPRLTSSDLLAMKPITIEIVIKLMNDQIVDAQVARAKVTELVNSSNLAKTTSREIVQELARFALTPNKFFDAKATDLAKAKARENTKIVYINKGDILLTKGDFITEEIYNRLKKADLLKDKANYLPHVGLFIWCVLLVLILYMFIQQSHHPIRNNNVPLIMLVAILFLNLIGMRVVALGQSLEFPHIGYMVPAAIGTMLIVILLDVPLAIICSVLFSVIASVIFNNNPEHLFDFRFGFIALIESFVAIFILQRVSQRSTILITGGLISVFAALGVVSFFLLEDQIVWKEIFYAVMFTMASGLVTAVIVMGIMPFFEAVFGILSPLKLVELSNPTHPLLRKLLTETPGTYHHSVMVGNLAESAAEAIGADGLLCRVGSFYHDIGKTKRPSYFIENQVNIENPHDVIDPALSKSIIVAHARDGVEMMKEYKIPKPLRDIAEQHHGTTLIKYFYHKALKKLPEGETSIVEERDFRYPGPKAQTKEAAIVGISDCIEAAVRSLRQPTVEQIDTMISKIIKERLDDGQFNECDLTIRDLEKIGNSLKESLHGIFHSRIEYPADLPPKNNDPKEA